MGWSWSPQSGVGFNRAGASWTGLKVTGTAGFVILNGVNLVPYRRAANDAASVRGGAVR